MVRATLIFLAVMGLIAWIGGLIAPRRWLAKRRLTGRCAACDRPRIGRGPCACGKS